MPNSLKCMFDKLEHKGRINKIEHKALIDKLEGHDTQLKVGTIEDCIDLIEHNFSIYDDTVFSIVQTLERLKVLKNGREI